MAQGRDARQGPGMPFVLASAFRFYFWFLIGNNLLPPDLFPLRKSVTSHNSACVKPVS